MKHCKSLDGIRGIAVLMVMCFHFGYLAPGWVGVQLFFILSGYLITGILLEGRQRPFGEFIGTFFWHRTVRILPLLTFFVLATAVVYLLWGVPVSFPSDWPWLAGFAANFARMRLTDVGPAFTHLWSLAVEQQFYLAWPFLVYFLPLAAFRRLVAGLLLLSPLIRLAIFQGLLQLGHDAEYAGRAVYVLPFTQFDAFAAGAAIPAFALQTLPHAGRALLGALFAAGVGGLAVLLAAYYGGEGAFAGSLGYAMYLGEGYGYVWGYSLLNLVFMLVVICALQDVGPTGVLKSHPLRWTGRISFGMYVYHVPLLLVVRAVFERLDPAAGVLPRAGIFVLWVLVVLAVSAASFRWLETPFLKLKNYWPRSPVVVES
jgi:peptidoglycan/LPS O-acetylase OafA/YrhL